MLPGMDLLDKSEVLSTLNDLPHLSALIYDALLAAFFFVSRPLVVRGAPALAHACLSSGHEEVELLRSRPTVVNHSVEAFVVPVP